MKILIKEVVEGLITLFQVIISDFFAGQTDVFSRVIIVCDALLRSKSFLARREVNDFNLEEPAIEINLNLPVARVIQVLRRILAWSGFPSQIRTDNGQECISQALCRTLD